MSVGRTTSRRNFRISFGAEFSRRIEGLLEEMRTAALVSLLILTARTTCSAEKSGQDEGSRRLERLEVVCGRDRMTVHVHFRRPFHGLVFSHGQRGHKCVHVGPRAGVTSASFDIRYDSCGTTEDVGGRFHENTIVVQFDEDVLEAGDEAKRLRCEWIESFEKKESSRPSLAIADLDAVELNFQGDDIDCWMEIQEGKGPWSRRVSGLVPVGSPLTLVVAIDDRSREFDVRVKRCTAGDGTGQSEVPLTDGEGCVLRPSLLTPFAKVRGDFGSRATLVAYSHLHAFKFPDQIDVYVHCAVEVCRHGCPDACTGGNGQHHPFLKGWGKPLESNRVESSTVRELRISAGHRPREEVPVLPGRKKNRVNGPPSAGDLRPAERNSTSVPSASRHVPTAHRIVGHDVHWLEEPAERYRQSPPAADRGPRPEPSAWSADEVKPLSKQEAFRTKQASSPQSTVDVVEHGNHLKKPYVTRILWSSQDAAADSRPSLPRKVTTLQVPQPEPAAWTFEELRGPATAVRFRLDYPEPRPEPASWTFDDAIGISGFRTLVGHRDPGTVPQPVYVSVHRNGSDQASTKGMNSMMMMMMMSTALPPTYRVTPGPPKHPRPLGHHYPYPVPQFSPHQRLMTGVVADRRNDEEEEDLSSHRTPDSGGESVERRVRIGETAGLQKSNKVSVDRRNDADGEEDLSSHRNPDSGGESSANRVRIGETAGLQKSADRPAVSGFVPPSLYPRSGGSNPETGEEEEEELLPSDRMRRKRRSSDSEFGVRQKFRAVAPSDLAFEWDLTEEGAAVLRGRRKEEATVYGVCMSPAGMGAGVGLVLVLTLLAIVASAVLYEHSCRLSRKTSRLSFLVRSFDGRLEALYRIARPQRHCSATAGGGGDLG